MKILDLYFRINSPTKITNGNNLFSINREDIGLISLTSGKIVACDPFLISQNENSFHQEILTGKYQVSLLIAKHKTDERIAAAIIRFSNLLPENWTLATRGSQKVTELKEGRIYGYPVDSGTGCFLDLESAESLNKKFTDDKNFFDKLNDAFSKNYVSTRSWAIYEIDAEKNLNAALFSTGYGDGLYPSYWGYAKDNSVVCLITDFHIINEEEFIELN